MNRQIGVKTLPCPKFHLRAVIWPTHIWKRTLQHSAAQTIHDRSSYLPMWPKSAVCAVAVLKLIVRPQVWRDEWASQITPAVVNNDKTWPSFLLRRQSNPLMFNIQKPTKFLSNGKREKIKRKVLEMRMKYLSRCFLCWTAPIWKCTHGII